jgi:hypothetical protein
MAARKVVQARIGDAPGKFLASARGYDRIPRPGQDERRATDRIEPGSRVELERDFAFGTIARQVWWRPSTIGASDIPRAVDA